MKLWITTTYLEMTDRLQFQPVAAPGQQELQLRVWVHTNTLDHPRALRNYQARGFRIFRREDEVVELPDEALQPWPGANVKD
jgi:hypothetical protein